MKISITFLEINRFWFCKFRQIAARKTFSAIYNLLYFRWRHRPGGHISCENPVFEFQTDLTFYITVRFWFCKLCLLRLPVVLMTRSSGGTCRKPFIAALQLYLGLSTLRRKTYCFALDYYTDFFIFRFILPRLCGVLLKIYLLLHFSTDFLQTWLLLSSPQSPQIVCTDFWYFVSFVR